MIGYIKIDNYRLLSTATILTLVTKEVTNLRRSSRKVRVSQTPNTKFHENPSSGSLVVQYERTDRRTDITTLIFASQISERV
jgi:hypothetical protein